MKQEGKVVSGDLWLLFDEVFRELVSHRKVRGKTGFIVCKYSDSILPPLNGHLKTNYG
jgi:hypothetical protein